MLGEVLGMEKAPWQDYKWAFEDIALKPCPFCGKEPYVESCDRLIDIGCEECGYHLNFHGLVQSEVETPVVVSRWHGGLPAEWYDKDAYKKAAAAWNRRVEG